MINLKCPECGFAFSVSDTDGFTDEELKEICECPCGATMNVVEYEDCINVVD
jgi:hypothetical protein